MALSALDQFCGSPLWDRDQLWNSSSPDVTPCFEATVLTWTPCAFLWMLAPLECYFQKKSRYLTLPWTGAIVSRIVVSFVLSVICLINIIDISVNQSSEQMYAASITAFALKALTFLFSIILMLVNRKTGRHTSGILFLFWLILTLCEVFSYRSAFLQIQNQKKKPDELSFVVHMIYFPFLLAQLILSSLADIRYQYPPSSKKEGKGESPEMCASFLSRLTFWWFNGLSVLGWRRALTLNDLWELNSDDKAENISRKFEKHCNLSGWSHSTGDSSMSFEDSSPFHGSYKGAEADVDIKVINGPHSGAKKDINIVTCLVKTFGLTFATGSICKLFYDLSQFINPLLLKLLIDFVRSDDPMWVGVLYSCCMFLNGTVQSALLGQYFHCMFRLGMLVRTALVSAIYKKSLSLSSSSRKESTVGEIVNLMSVDSQRFMDLMTYLNLLWSAPLQIVLAVVLLWQQLGPSVLAGLFVMIILFPVNGVIASYTRRMQAKQMKKKDKRVKLINEVLNGIKVLKLYAWEEAFNSKIHSIREKEIKDLKKMSYVQSIAVLLWSVSPFMVALASFTTYVLVNDKVVLDASTAFVSLSLFNILRFPLSMLPFLITNLAMAKVSVNRINRFMNCEELQKYVTWDNKLAYAISIQNGTFTWDKLGEENPPQKSNDNNIKSDAIGPDESKELKPTLRSIDLNVEKGSLVAVVGQVGCGKSSLLSAIIGDMFKLAGTVSVNGKIAYVSQQPWIQNGTLKENVLFSSSLDKKMYEETLEACGLKPDLEILPGGDQTEIGEKGINLSGGQKQRISLARAVYSSRDIYLLDDPLSAVDSHVGKHIFEQVIGPTGLLKNKTRVMVTHGLTYLPKADIIYVMKDGVVAEKGSFQELLDSKGPFAEFLSQYLSEASPDEEEMEVLEEVSKKNPDFLRNLSTENASIPEDLNSLSDSGKRMSINCSPIERSHSRSVEKSAEQKEHGKLTNVEAVETKEVHWSVYLSYVKSMGICSVVIIAMSYVIWQCFAVGANVWLSDWNSDEPTNDTELDTAQRNHRLYVYGLLGTGEAIGVFMGSFLIAHGTLIAASVLHDALLKNVLRSPMSFFDTTPIGRIVNRFGKDIDTVDVTIPMTIRSWLSCFFQVLATLIVICSKMPIFILVVLPISFIYYFIQRFYVSTSRQLKRLESITRSPIYTHFSETLSGASTIRAYSAEERFCIQSNSLVDKNQICYYPSTVSNRWLAVRLDICGNCFIVFTAIFGVLQRESSDAGSIALAITYSLMITQTLNWLVRMTSELETNIVAVERVLEYSVTPVEPEWIISSNRPAPEWPQNGHVVFDEYSTRYRPGLDLVLRNICCDIKPKEKIGIVGRTGAGKSSLTLSLFRIIEAATGKIDMDHETIANLGLHDLRSKITIIPQDPVLFSGTLRMNLDPFNWYSDSQLWEAIEHAHLKSFVSGLDSGLQHELVEGGENLSVGQRQLVCLARALLRKTKILVLDEATAAVDLETDSLIQSTIRQEFANSSVLTIAHRLNTIMDYDRVMVLDKGVVAEFDSPSVLLKDKHSTFYSMAKDAGLV